MRWLGVAISSVLAMAAMPAQAELVVTISKSQQQAAVTIDGAEAYRWPVSTGRRGFDTPSGTYRPERLEPHWYSRKYDNAPMPWSVFFYRGYAVHGTTEVANLGRAASHGCVRLHPDNAQALFSLVRQQGYRKTRIVVTDGGLPGAPGAVPMAANEKTADADSDSGRGFAKAFREIERRDDRTSRATAGRDDNGRRERDQRFERPLRVYDRDRASGESRVLLDREAWLRGLDRKYGIVR
jgi:hypothetical protein